VDKAQLAVLVHKDQVVLKEYKEQMVLLVD
jgi:hypothetical protein